MECCRPIEKAIKFLEVITSAEATLFLHGLRFITALFYQAIKVLSDYSVHSTTPLFYRALHSCKIIKTLVYLLGLA